MNSIKSCELITVDSSEDELNDIKKDTVKKKNSA